MNKYFFIVLSLLLAHVASGQDLVILHTNDLHSHLNGFSPETEYTPTKNDSDVTKGGFARIAGFIKNQKALYGNKTLVVDAGDFLMGTLFQTIEPISGFQLNLMKIMGYDYIALGNHEFDFGPDKLADIINNNRNNGPIPQLLCSNYAGTKIVDDKKITNLFNCGIIAKYKITEKNGLKIGIFALMGKDADKSIASYYGLKWEKQKKVAKATSKYLKKVEKVDLVILLSHSGIEKNKKGEWGGEDIEYAKAAPCIDIIISGHTHTRINRIIHSGNAAIVQTGSYGMNVGKLMITMSRGNHEVKYELIEMNDNITTDASIQEKIDNKIPEIERNILAETKVKFNTPIAETTFDLVIDESHPQQSNLGPFVADAIYYYLNKKCNTPVDITLVASGIIRNNIKKGKSGAQNINDIFNVMPLGSGNDSIPGSPLGKIYVTAHEFKKVLELILSVAPKQPNYYLYYSGIKIQYNPDKGLFRKISSIKIGDSTKGYKTLDTCKRNKQLVGIAANKYLISFMGRIRKMSFGLVKVVPKDKNGKPIQGENFLIDTNPDRKGLQEAKEWLSMYYYINSFSDNNGNGIPEIPAIYKKKKNPLIVVKKD